jgi:hypothetical protein
VFLRLPLNLIAQLSQLPAGALGRIYLGGLTLWKLDYHRSNARRHDAAKSHSQQTAYDREPDTPHYSLFLIGIDTQK